MRPDFNWVVSANEAPFHHPHDVTDVNSGNDIIDINSGTDVIDVNSGNDINQPVALSNSSRIDSFNSEEGCIDSDDMAFPGQGVKNDASNFGEELPQRSQASSETVKVPISDLPVVKKNATGFFQNLKAGHFGTAFKCCSIPSSSDILEDVERSYRSDKDLEEKKVEEKKLVTSSKKTIKVKSVDDLLAQNITVDNTEVCLVDTPKGKVLVFESISEGSSSQNQVPNFTKKQLLNACFAVNSNNDVILAIGKKNLPFSKTSSKSFCDILKVPANSLLEMKKAGPLNAKTPFFAITENDTIDFTSKYYPPPIGEETIKVYALSLHGQNRYSLAPGDYGTDPGPSSSSSSSRVPSLRPGGSESSSYRNLMVRRSRRSSSISISSGDWQNRSTRRLTITARQSLETDADIMNFVKSKNAYKNAIKTNKPHFIVNFVNKLETDVTFASNLLLQKSLLVAHLKALAGTLFCPPSNPQAYMPELSQQEIQQLSPSDQHLASPLRVLNKVKFNAMLQQAKGAASRYHEVFAPINFGKYKSKHLKEEFVSKVLNNALASAIQLKVQFSPQIEADKNLQLQTWFPTLVAESAPYKDLDKLRKFFYLSSPNDSNINIFINSIAGLLDQSGFSVESLAIYAGFVSFLIHENVTELDIDHLTMQLLHSAIRTNITGKVRSEGDADINLAVLISKWANVARGGTENTLLPPSWNNRTNNVFISGIGSYLNVLMIYSLLDDAVIINLLEQHQPYCNGRGPEIDNYLRKIKNGLLSYPYSAPLSQENKDCIENWISGSQVDFNLQQLKALLTSMCNGIVRESHIIQEVYVEPLGIPIQAECAFYFLNIRIDHFAIKCRADQWLKAEIPLTQRTQNPNKQHISEARNLVEDLFKQISVTIEFMKECDPKGDWSEVRKDLIKRADSKVLQTLHELVFASGRYADNAFASSFTNKADFIKWMKDTKNLTTFPEAIEGSFMRALSSVNPNKIATMGAVLNTYIINQNLARSTSAQ